MGGFTIYGLSTRHETVKNGKTQSYPAFYNTKGELTPLTNIDGTNGLIYHKKTGSASSAISDTKLAACSVFYQREYPMQIIAFFPKNILNVDNNYIEEKVFENISNAIQANNPKPLRAALKALNITISTKNFSSDRQQILDSEIKNYDLKLPTEWAVISIDYTVTIEASERCFEQWACNDVREIPQFYFPKNFSCAELTNEATGLTNEQKECVLPTIPCDILTDLEILTEAQIECLAAAFGGSCPDGDININGVSFGSVAAGGLIEIPVVNSGATPVGTVNAGVNVAIGNSAIRRSDTTLISNVAAEQPYTVADTLVKNSANTTIGTALAAGANVPIADSAITVNGGAYGSTPATVAGNVDVENTAGTDVGALSGVKWIVGNSAVTNGNGVVSQVPATTAFTCQAHITVTFTSDVQEASAGVTTVTFTGTTTNATSWLWNFGDGTTSTLQNPTKVYASSGDYTVTLTASNANPASGAFTRALYINVYQPESISLFARFTGAPATARKRVIDNLILGLKNAGIWTELDALWITAAHDTQASTLNWKSTSFTLADVNAPTFTADRGVLGNGTTSYRTTSYTPSSSGVKYVLNSGTMFFYTRTDNVSTGIEMGARAAGTQRVEINSKFTDNLFYAAINNAGGAGYMTVNPGDTLGLFAVRRFNSTSVKGYKDGAEITNASTTSTSLPNIAAFFGALNSSGVAVNFSTRQLACGGFGSGNINQEVLYTLIQAYMTAVGANV